MARKLFEVLSDIQICDSVLTMVRSVNDILLEPSPFKERVKTKLDILGDERRDLIKEHEDILKTYLLENK